MIGKIQDMTAAAVVVSAMEKGSAAAPQRERTGNSSSKDNSDYVQQSKGFDVTSRATDLDPSQRINKIDKAATYGSQQDDEEDEDRLPGMPNIDDEFVSEMTKELNELMSKLNCDIEFQYHKEVDVMSVRMVDKETKEVIKEYPPEDMVEGMIRAQEWLGAFLDKNA